MLPVCGHVIRLSLLFSTLSILVYFSIMQNSINNKLLKLRTIVLYGFSLAFKGYSNKSICLGFTYKTKNKKFCIRKT